MSEPSDDELLASSGDDPEAFRELYRRHAVPLLTYLRRNTEDAETAVDLLAETFAIAYEKREKHNPKRGPAGAWIFGIARNQVRRTHRRKSAESKAVRRLGIQIGALDEDSLARIEELVDARSEHHALAAAMGELGAADRTALNLRVMQQQNYEDVAQQLECSVPTARVRVHRALAKLAARMEMN